MAFYYFKQNVLMNKHIIASHDGALHTRKKRSRTKKLRTDKILIKTRGMSLRTNKKKKLIERMLFLRREK